MSDTKMESSLSVLSTKIPLYSKDFGPVITQMQGNHSTRNNEAIHRKIRALNAINHGIIIFN